MILLFSFVGAMAFGPGTTSYEASLSSVPSSVIKAQSQQIFAKFDERVVIRPEFLQSPGCCLSVNWEQVSGDKLEVEFLPSGSLGVTIPKEQGSLWGSLMNGVLGHQGDAASHSQSVYSFGVTAEFVSGRVVEMTYSVVVNDE